MGQKFSEKEKELYKRIDEIIHYIWDPIGVSGCPEARYEYYSYLPKLFNLLRDKESKEYIVKYLDDIQSNNMGLSSDISRCKEIAVILLDWSNNLGFIEKI